MKTFSIPRLALLAAALCGLSAHAQTSTSPVPLSDWQYAAVQDRIDADYKAAKAACDRLSGNAQDICTEQAKGKRKVAEADLQYQRSGKAADAAKAAEIRVEADY